MNTLDTPAAPGSGTPIWNTVLRYGGYLGGLMVAFSLISYLAEIDMTSMGGVLILYTSIIILGSVMAVMAIRHQRDQLDGGLISYGKALGIGVLVIMLGMFISGIWSYILINFIDPGYIDWMKERFAAHWGDKIPEDALEEALKGFEKAGSLFESLKSSVTGGAIFGLIISLITAAFMKREPMKDYMR